MPAELRTNLRWRFDADGAADEARRVVPNAARDVRVTRRGLTLDSLGQHLDREILLKVIENPCDDGIECTRRAGLVLERHRTLALTT